MSLVRLMLFITVADFHRLMEVLKSRKAYARLYKYFSSVFTPEWIREETEENGLEEDDLLIDEDYEPAMEEHVPVEGRFECVSTLAIELNAALSAKSGFTVYGVDVDFPEDMHDEEDEEEEDDGRDFLDEKRRQMREGILPYDDEHFSPYMLVPHPVAYTRRRGERRMAEDPVVCQRCGKPIASARECWLDASRGYGQLFTLCKSCGRDQDVQTIQDAFSCWEEMAEDPNPDPWDCE